MKDGEFFYFNRVQTCLRSVLLLSYRSISGMSAELPSTYLDQRDLAALAQTPLLGWRTAGILPVLVAAEVGHLGVQLGQATFRPAVLQNARPVRRALDIQDFLRLAYQERPLDAANRANAGESS